MKKFEQYLTDKKFSKHTILSYTKRLSQFEVYCKSKNVTLRKVTHKNVVLYVRYLKKTNSHHSINQHLLSLRHYYTFLNVKVNPVIHINKVSRQSNANTSNCLSSEQLLQLYNSYEILTTIDYRDKAILGLLCFQALKTKEINNLKVNDIDLNNTTVKLHNRTLDLHSCQLIDLYKYITTERNTIIVNHSLKIDSELFFSTYGKSCNNVFNRLMKKVNIKHISILRKSVIVNWLKQHNLRKTQYYAGHKYISSTEQYLTTDIDNLKMNVLLLHPL